MQALWMLLAAFLFASMSVCVKFASAYFNSAELVLSRGLIGMALLAWLARSQGVALATRYPRMHAWRAFIGVISLGGWFYAIAHLPLATAVTLNYMSSVWIAAFLVGGALINWRPSPDTPRPALQGPLLLTVAAGFGGVVLLLRPSLGEGVDQALGALVGLGSVVAGGAAVLVTGHSPWPGWPALWLLPIGVLAAGGQLCMTRAYASAHNPRATLVVANLQYSGIVFGALYGMAVFGDVIPPLGWLGMALIIGSGIVATALRARTSTPHAAEEL
jgi:drug/metabolite transporter (DMT)-like permease